LRGVTGAARGAGAGMFAVFRGRGQHARGRCAEGRTAIVGCADAGCDRRFDGVAVHGTGGSGKKAGSRRAGVSRGEIYLPALASCFPGKAPGSGDRAPSWAMIANCRPHLSREFELLRPEVVAPVGGLAVRELLGIGRLSEAVGETILRDGVIYVPLPHPSGASTWLNLPENRGRLFRTLAELGRLVADGRIGGSGARARRLKS
jgi:uracil-DNA glycosylase family 4